MEDLGLDMYHNTIPVELER